jgi:hypothetical protein
MFCEYEKMGMKKWFSSETRDLCVLHRCYSYFSFSISRESFTSLTFCLYVLTVILNAYNLSKLLFSYIYEIIQTDLGKLSHLSKYFINANLLAMINVNGY